MLNRLRGIGVLVLCCTLESSLTMTFVDRLYKGGWGDPKSLICLLAK